MDKKINPNWEKGELLTLQKAECEKKQTEPPPRYSEGTLVAKLEREGIGRPSTYSTVSEILVKRKYVEQEKNFFIRFHWGKRSTFFCNPVLEIYFEKNLPQNSNQIWIGSQKTKLILFPY
ncbi:DNA topoisomerase domain protein [Leptospira weilii serovar Topaz str. LT2116]|uniref:DNA topoisomerase domain protein n=1 Tax=Leptospira weilii serovar Topaz str. LT2116 TaxID=1088540 RepID=M3EQ96_9LEPT|nr:DNA topoisomerase domain protein [Leptospira weilii serovar Topaz str. LT2116]